MTIKNEPAFFLKKKMPPPYLSGKNLQNFDQRWRDPTIEKFSTKNLQNGGVPFAKCGKCVRTCSTANFSSAIFKSDFDLTFPPQPQRGFSQVNFLKTLRKYSSLKSEKSNQHSDTSAQAACLPPVYTTTLQLSTRLPSLSTRVQS